jgi:hypothetical protein
MAEYLDKAGATYLVGKIQAELAGKVNVEVGKGLSTNDFTDAEQEKLAGLQNYTLPAATEDALGGVKSGGDISVNSSGTVTVPGLSGKAPIANPTFTGAPKAPTPDTDDSSTNIATTAFVQAAVAAGVAGITGFEFEVVSALPGTGETGKIYLVSNGGSTQNAYDEYIWVNNSWEKIGTTAVDLSGYWSKTELTAIQNTEIDAMFA